MATEIIMPKAGMAMERGTIIQWLKQPGDAIEVGEPILEIETDKVSMEVEAETAGYLIGTLYDAGDEVEVITTIGYIGEKGEQPPAAAESPLTGGDTGEGANTSEGAETRVKATPAARFRAKEAGIDISGVTPSGKWGEVRAADVEAVSPRGTAGGPPPRVSSLARAEAERHGVDPATVEGSGPGGRVLQQDVLDAAERRREPVDASATAGSPRPLTAMRRTIAQRMVESHRSIPPVTLNKKIDVTALFSLREQINRERNSLEHTKAPQTTASQTTAPRGEKHNALSLNPFFVRATALALRESPWMRTTLEDDALVEHHDIHIGIAVALEEGLLVPVLRNADTLSLEEVHHTSAELITRARERKLTQDEMQGGVFSITNLGMFGISSFNPIINPPQTAILGINAAEEQLYLEDGQVKARKVMTLSLTIDHRVIDGAQGAIFLQKLEGYLTRPTRILL